MWPFFILAALVAFSRKRDASPSSRPNKKVSKSGIAEIKKIVRELGLDAAWADFLAAVACHESSGYRLVGAGVTNDRLEELGVKIRKSESEAAAAQVMYMRNQQLFERCGRSPMEYGWGSGGWYGILAPNGVYAFSGTPDVCLDPIGALFDARISTIMAVGYAQRLMRWRGFRVEPTWAALDRGWAAPRIMDTQDQATRDRLASRLVRCLRSTGGNIDINAAPTPLPDGWTPFRAMHGRP